MNLIHELVIGAAVCLGFFGGGYLVGRNSVELPVPEIRTVTQVQDRIVEKEGKVQVVTQFRDRIVTVTKIQKPDGTVKETTRTEEKSENTDTKKEKQVQKNDHSEKTETKTAAEPVQSRYGLGVQFRPAEVPSYLDTQTYRDYRNYSVLLSYRVAAPIWLEAGVSGRREVSLGIRVEFY